VPRMAAVSFRRAIVTGNDDPGKNVHSYCRAPGDDRRSDPQKPHQRRVDIEILGHTPGYASPHTLTAAACQAPVRWWWGRVWRVGRWRGRRRFRWLVRSWLGWWRGEFRSHA